MASECVYNIWGHRIRNPVIQKGTDPDESQKTKEKPVALVICIAVCVNQPNIMHIVGIEQDIDLIGIGELQYFMHVPIQILKYISIPEKLAP